MSPDGLILHAAGPLEGRRLDWTLYMRSRLAEELEGGLHIEETQYCIYGDSGHNRRAWMEIYFTGTVLTAEQQARNVAMPSCRVTVEWLFKDIKLHWSTVDFKRKMLAGQSPVGAMYLAAMLVRNFRNYCYPGTTSRCFNCRSPSLESYTRILAMNYVS
jgi:DDE superfamily endonuclease